MTDAPNKADQKEKELSAARESYKNAWAALRMVRQAIEELGPVGVLPSEEAVLATLGPEPVHEATALVEGIRKIAARGKGMEEALVASSPAIDSIMEYFDTLNEWFGRREAGLTPDNSEEAMFAQVHHRLGVIEPVAERLRALSRPEGET